jgi:hydrogenase maturation protease
MATIVLGLGNPCLGDDAIGWRILDALEARLDPALHPGLALERLSLGGLSLMERLAGFDRAIIVDSINLPGGRPGELQRLSLESLPGTHANAAHDASLADALQLGRKMGVRLPDEIAILAIQIERRLEFSETLTPEVEASIEPAVQTLLTELILS